MSMAPMATRGLAVRVAVHLSCGKHMHRSRTASTPCWGDVSSPYRRNTGEDVDALESREHDALGALSLGSSGAWFAGQKKVYA